MDESSIQQPVEFGSGPPAADLTTPRLDKKNDGWLPVIAFIKTMPVLLASLTIIGYQLFLACGGVSWPLSTELHQVVFALLLVGVLGGTVYNVVVRQERRLLELERQVRDLLSERTVAKPR